MSLSLVAAKDVRDAVRERQLHLLLALFGAVGLGLGYFFTDGTAGLRDPTPALVGSVGLILSFLVPLAALGLGHASLVGKRIRGELKVLLGLPFSRGELVAGTFVGRTAVVLSGLVAATGSALLMVTVRGVSVSVVPYALFVVLLGVLAVTFVAIAVGISAATGDTTRSSAAAFGFFLLFVFRVWDLLPNGVLYLLNGFSAPRSTPEWATAFTHVDPLTAFGNVLAGTIPETREMMGILGVQVAGYRESLSLAAYETAWFGLAVLGLWTLVSLAVGYRRFSGADL